MERVIIVGAGLAGACAAHALRHDHHVTVVDAGPTVAAAASGVAAGLANPFPGRRASPAWQHAEALEVLEEMTKGLERGLLRPAGSPTQRDEFRRRVEDFPDGLQWLPRESVAERWPSVRAPFGALWVRRGLSLDMRGLIEELVADVTVCLNSRVMEVLEDEQGAAIVLDTGERIEGDVVVLAPGDGFRALTPMSDLPLGRLKGQVVQARSSLPSNGLPPVVGNGYVIPHEGELTLGTTHERRFSDTQPNRKATDSILEKARRMVDLGDVSILEERAGVRVTVPPQISQRRLPMVGPLPGHRRVWGFIGLGSKGLLTAPLLSRRLPGWLADPGSILPEVRLVGALRRG